MSARSGKKRQQSSAERNEERVREETRQEERARAKEEAVEVERSHGRLRHLYEISKLLTRFDTVERIVPKILALLTEAVPLRIAILMLEERGVRAGTRAILWHAEGMSAARLRAAKAHAKMAYGYLVGPAALSRVEEEAGESMLPGASTARPPPEDGRKDGFVLLPLVVDHRRIFGALLVESAIRLDEADLAFVNAVVNQLAIALDRIAVVAARQAEAEAGRAAAERAAIEAQRDEQTQRFLAETSALLFSSLEYGKTHGAVIRAAVPLLADMCYIDEVAEDGQIQRLEVATADPTKQHLADRIRQFPPGPGWQTPPSQVLRSGESVLIAEVSSFEAIAQDQAHAELLKEAGVQSMMSVPLVARGRTLGALTFLAAESGRRYSSDDLDLAEEVGRRAALAIDNARLYEQAQRAIHARQDMLAIVSHDLKNLLGVILMRSALLLKTPAGEELRLGSRRVVEKIRRSAERMKRLIEDLLDLASIEAGRLTVEKKRHPIAPLVQEALELLEPMAVQKNLRLERELPSERLDIDCDRERVLQVFGNLIGNAIKFTPEGGTIKVRAEMRGDETRFSVADTGPGIRPDDLPHVFDRYWQAKKTARLGTGLGLSIAEGLVEAHGGRIWVESTPGRGSTFFFTIPTAPRVEEWRHEPAPHGP